jgi:tetratricopeptide (TPR) repeat protein
MVCLASHSLTKSADRSPAGPRRLAPITVGLVLGLVACGSVCAQGSDTIEPTQGRDIRCTIKSTTPQGINYEINGQAQQINVVDVASVKFAGEPNEFGRARTRIEGGQFDDALTELQKINPSQLNELQKAEFAYLHALANARKSLRDGTLTLREGAATVNQFLQAHPNSFHVFEMTEIFGWMAFHSGEFAAGVKSFETLANSGIPSLALSGHLGLARTALEQSQWEEAGRQLDAIASLDANDNQSQDIKLIGRCLSARILAEQDQVAQAIGLLEEIIKSENNDRTRVFANLYNAMGLVYMKAGDPKSALRAFLHTDLLYSGEADPHAEALYYLTGIWSQINETDRSNRAKQTLSQQYRNSLWASKQ